MRVFHEIKVGLDEELEDKIRQLVPAFSSYRILKKSVDARQRHFPHFVYSLEVYADNEKPHRPEFNLAKVDYRGDIPLIIGSGPAGLFAALRFVEQGVPCRLFEQGSESTPRMKAINRFWRYGELDPLNNVCFGEGGAGLYSDGKLITRIKSPDIPYVMNRLVRFGAPEEIEFLANPHVGSDRIRRVIPKIREFILANGGEIHFNSKVTEILSSPTFSGNASGHMQVQGIKLQNGEIFNSDKIILATGHSSADMFKHLKEIGVYMEGKSFALGLRIEHPQNKINQIQFRDAALNPKLGAASYRLAYHDHPTDIGVYSFCMCPGGYVLSSGTEARQIVSNGMSNYKRNSPFANAAIVVSVDHRKNFGAENIWGGMNFRQKIETHAWQMVQNQGGTKELPAQKLMDFLNKRLSSGPLASSSPSGIVSAPLHELFSDDLYQNLKNGLEKVSGPMPGFICEEAVLHGVESRTSCPVRVTRDPVTLESLSHRGLYPCGEGAGYAGGITSAACDGIKIVDKIVQNISSQAQAGGITAPS